MKKNFLAIVFTAIYLFLFLVSVYAADEKQEKSFKSATYFDAGEKFSIAFGYEESDLADDIKYWRNGNSLQQKVNSQLRYTISQLFEKRDFDNNNSFDNRFAQTVISSTYKLPESGFFLIPKELRTSYTYKHKDYFNGNTEAVNNDYVQNKFSLGISYLGDKENWGIDYDAGINSFDYSVNSINNENKIFNQIRVKKKLLSDKLLAFAGYKINYAYRKNNDNRTEPEKLVGFDFKPGFKYLSLISFKFENGKSETREEEIRDDIRNYKYERFITKVDIPLAPKVSNSFTHKFIERKYADWNKSYHQLKMEDILRYTQFNNKVRALYYDFILEYKLASYVVVDTSSTIQRTTGLALTYEKKNDWKISPKFTYRVNEFPDRHGSDSKRYIIDLGLEKSFSQDLSFAFGLHKELWYYYKRGEPDKAYESYKISLNYTF